MGHVYTLHEHSQQYKYSECVWLNQKVNIKIVIIRMQLILLNISCFT